MQREQKTNAVSNRTGGGMEGGCWLEKEERKEWTKEKERKEERRGKYSVDERKGKSKNRR